MDRDLRPGYPPFAFALMRLQLIYANGVPIFLAFWASIRMVNDWIGDIHVCFHLQSEKPFTLCSRYAMTPGRNGLPGAMEDNVRSKRKSARQERPSLTLGDQNAEALTMNMVEGLEEVIQCKPEFAVIYLNSTLAAAAVIAARYQLDSALLKETYEEAWDPAVVRILRMQAN